MEILGLCTICGKPSSLFTCMFCGKTICRTCYDIKHNICINCQNKS